MRISLLAFFLLQGLTGLFAQSFYNPEILQEIKITFGYPNWDFKLDSLKNIDDGDYLLALSVEINGEVFDSVGVKYKGNSSYSANNAKNPLHIQLDFVRKNQHYQSFENIKLSNCFADPTFVREVTSYEILRQYMDASRANHAKVWINGEYYGLYANVESVNKRFVREHFFTDGDNPFFKCNPEDFGGPGTGGNYPDLVYSSADSTFYYNKYDIQSDNGWKELVQLMDSLKNSPAKVPNILDVDRALWMLAFNNVMVNLDSYTGAFVQNYYLYHDKNERWLPISWDLNMSYGAFPLLNATGGSGTILSLTQMKQMDPLIQSTNINRPLIRTLLSNPTWKRMYLAHLRTILTENFSNLDYRTRALEIQAVIDAAVQADTKKFYTYNDFTKHIDQPAGAGLGGNVPGITDLMNARYTYLANNSNISAQAPGIQEINPIKNVNSIKFSVEISHAVTSVWVNVRRDSSRVFQSIQMFDDGLHGDGAIGDGVFAVTAVFQYPKIQYYYYAENTNAGTFLPARAEHEFFNINILPAPGEVVINEILAQNENGQTDEAIENEDWIELYNNTAEIVNLNGLYLSDNPDNLNKWKFPAGTALPPFGYLMIWLDEDDLQGPFHANFKLSALGESLFLSDGESIIVDSISFGLQGADITFGCFPNGTGPFVYMLPTFDATNSPSISTNEPFLTNVRVYPQPTYGLLNIESSGMALGRLQIIDAQGRKLISHDAADARSTSIDIGRLPSGIYLLTSNGQVVRKIQKM